MNSQPDSDFETVQFSINDLKWSDLSNSIYIQERPLLEKSQ